MKHLTLNETKDRSPTSSALFWRMSPGQLFTYSESFSLQDVKVEAAKHGVTIEYCGPDTEEHREHGDRCCKVVPDPQLPWYIHEDMNYMKVTDNQMRALRDADLIWKGPKPQNIRPDIWLTSVSPKYALEGEENPKHPVDDYPDSIELSDVQNFIILDALLAVKNGLPDARRRCEETLLVI